MSDRVSGIGASSGVAVGRAHLLSKALTQVQARDLAPQEVPIEIVRFQSAVTDAKMQIQDIYKQTKERMGQEEADVFQAHLAFLDDPAFVAEIESRIERDRTNAEVITEAVTREMGDMLAAIPDEYLQARADDIRDVGRRLLDILLGIKRTSPDVEYQLILVTDDLTPSQSAQLPPQTVGVVSRRGSKTGHAAIICRTLGIPLVVGVRDQLSLLADGEPLIVDGDRGLLVISPTESEIVEASLLQNAAISRHQEAQREALAPATTTDGARIQVFANIGNLKDVPVALAHGAEGVGLFRTEFVYQESAEWPTEEEQYDIYREVLTKFGGNPVIIRTLDVGGDKPLPYANMPDEENPFLGLRALRFCLANPAIFKVQLRALLRASIHGGLWIMFPMVANVSEIVAAKTLLEESRRELVQEGCRVSLHVPIGIMVEIPAVAIMADAIAPHVDFMSVGTNDLTQYTLAADRGNEAVAFIYDAAHPAVLRLIEMTCKAASAAGIVVGVCGELAGDVDMIETLIGLGVTELSMSGRLIPHAKRAIRQVLTEDAKSVAKQTLHAASADAARATAKGNSAL